MSYPNTPQGYLDALAAAGGDVSRLLISPSRIDVKPAIDPVPYIETDEWLQPNDDLRSALMSVASSLTKSSSNNTRQTGGTLPSRTVKLAPGKHALSQSFVVDVDGMEIEGLNPGVTEIAVTGNSRLQFGVDAAAAEDCRNVKAVRLANLSVVGRSGNRPLLEDGFPDGVVSSRLMSFSSFENVYIKNLTGNADTGGLYYTGGQWNSFDHLHVDGFGRYCLGLDSQSPETWEVLTKFSSSQFVMGTAAGAADGSDGLRSASVYLMQRARLQAAGYSALNVKFDTCHIAYYPGDGSYFYKQSRGVYADPAIVGSDIALSFDECLFENHRAFIEVGIDSNISFKKPCFFGNNHTANVVLDDGGKVRFYFESPLIVSVTENGIIPTGSCVITGNGKVSGSMSGTKVRVTSALRMTGQISGWKHDARLEPAITTGATSHTVSGLALAAVPMRIEILPSWSTTVAVSKASETADGFTILFGTAAPSGATCRIYASVCN